MPLSTLAGRAGGVVLFMAVNAALLVATIGSGMGAQLGAARLLYAMGRDGALPPKVFGAVEPKKRIPGNNVLLIGVISLLGALVMTYETGAELLNFGALLAFMGVNLSSVRHALRFNEHGRAALIPFGSFGFVVCLVLRVNLSLGKIAGTSWACLGILLWLVRRNSMTATQRGGQCCESRAVHHHASPTQAIFGDNADRLSHQCAGHAQRGSFHFEEGSV